MESVRRVTAAGLAIAAFVLSAGSPASPAGSVASAAPRVSWKPCTEDATVQCGTIKLPVNWRRPGGATFDMGVVRRPATDRAARIGALVVNPGGPGASGVDFVLYNPEYLSEGVRRRFDIVSFDPRGVSRSHPVVCALEVVITAPAAEITTAEGYGATTAYNSRLGRDCRKHTGPLADHVDTLSVVRDLDALRAALGDRRLSFYGVSYGSLIGQQYAELFPGKARAIVLDSAMDHSTGTRRFLREGAAAAQSAFEAFVAGCGADPECALRGRDIKAVFRGLLARARRGELSDPTFPEYKPTPFDIATTAVVSFYAPDWRSLAAYLLALETGQPQTTVAVAPTVPASRQAPEVIENSFATIFCADWRLPVADFADLAGYARTAELLAPDMRLSPVAYAAVTGCLGWPGKVRNPQHRLKLRVKTPLLVLGSMHDPATPYAWSARVAKQAGDRAVLVTYEGWGHGVYQRGDCPRAAVDAYLLELKLPAQGTRCPAIPPTTTTSERTGLAPHRVGPRPGVPGWLAPRPSR
jgi:pimeloyl-ACP methyl ester carboxylesterase